MMSIWRTAQTGAVDLPFNRLRVVSGAPHHMVQGGVEPRLVVHHAELDKGTLKAIYRQALRHIPENELKSHFYSER